MSPYITHWKPPKLHVRQNQFAAQLLLQLISLVGEWSALCVEYGTSQRSRKCWSQLGRTRHLSLPNGKSIRVWWRLLNRPACPVADRDGFCCCNNAAWLQHGCSSSYAAVRADRSCEPWNDPLIPPANAQMLFPNKVFRFQEKSTVKPWMDAEVSITRSVT